MKFTLVKDLRSDPLMRPVLIGVLLFLLLFFISDLFVMQDQIGLHVSKASQTLYGDEAQYLDPIAPLVLLELIHANLFMSMLSLLTLSAVFIRLETREKRARLGVHLLMLSALLAPALLYGASFGIPLLMAVWLLFYWLNHLIALLMILFSLWRLARL